MAVVLCNVLVDELSELKKNTTVNAGQKQGIVLKSGFSKPCFNILTSNSLCYCCEVGYCIKYPAPAQQPVWYNAPTDSSLPQDIYKVVVKHRKTFGTCTHVYAISAFLSLITLLKVCHMRTFPAQECLLQFLYFRQEEQSPRIFLALSLFLFLKRSFIGPRNSYEIYPMG